MLTIIEKNLTAKYHDDIYLKVHIYYYMFLWGGVNFRKSKASL